MSAMYPINTPAQITPALSHNASGLEPPAYPLPCGLSTNIVTRQHAIINADPMGKYSSCRFLVLAYESVCVDMGYNTRFLDIRILVSEQIPRHKV